MEFYPGFDIESRGKDMEFVCEPDVSGPKPEKRTLEAIRSSLQDPSYTGPEILYSIAMDVGKKQDHTAITERNLLYGAMTYAKGTLGKEPVRSQGHIHAISPSCQSSACEVYEIWDGEAFIYMQEYGKDDAGNRYAVHAKAGEVVIIPLGWVHATINANMERPPTFGAWCARDFGSDHGEVRAHHGTAYFPVVEAGNITWEINPAYKNTKLHVIAAHDYPQLDLEPGKPIYMQFTEDPDRFLFVSRPRLKEKEWEEFYRWASLDQKSFMIFRI